MYLSIVALPLMGAITADFLVVLLDPKVLVLLQQGV